MVSTCYNYYKVRKKTVKCYKNTFNLRTKIVNILNFFKLYYQSREKNFKTFWMTQLFFILLFYFIILFFWPHRVARGILALRRGIEPVPLAVGAWSLNHWTTRGVPTWLFFKMYLHTAQQWARTI